MCRDPKVVVCILIFALVFSIPSGRGATTARVYVDPRFKVGLLVDELYHVNVTVADVTNLFAWEFQMCYRSDILNASSWNPGPVFSSGLHIEALTDNHNETHGLIHIVCTFFGSQAFNGTTTLATIEFKIKSLGTTALHLQNTVLLDNSEPWPYAIAHTAEDGLITDAMPGDLNADGQVNILDISIVAKAFGSKPGDQAWNPICDLDNSGTINIIDISKVAKEFGKKYAP